MLSAKHFLYIIGSPRSGTTMLQILLSQHPQVASTVEQTLFQHYVSPWLENWEIEVRNLQERNWKLGLPILWQEEELKEVLAGFLEKAYSKILALKPEATHVLDKHPGYSLHIPTIKRFVPQARFIHMIRDGRDVASSTVAANRKMGFGPSTVPLAAAKWKKFLLSARQAAEFPDAYLEVRYEEFLSRGADAYAEVLDFCGLTYSRGWIEEILESNSFEKMKESGVSPDGRTKLSEKRYHRGKPGGWHSDFSPRDRFDFERIAGDLLQELGYANPDWWIQRPSDRVLLPFQHGLEKRASLLTKAIHSAGAALLGRDEEYHKRRLEAEQK